MENYELSESERWMYQQVGLTDVEGSVAEHCIGQDECLATPEAAAISSAGLQPSSGDGVNGQEPELEPYPLEHETLPRGHEFQKYIHGPGIDSYSRMASVFDLFLKAGWQRKRECMQALGEAWQGCDSIVEFTPWLKDLLRTAEVDDLRAMMSPADREAWEKLPSIVTVWRGCYHNNRRGLSWTLDEQVARSFPLLHRYRQDGKTPLLLQGRISKERIVLKLEREEMAVVTLPPRRVTSVELPSSTAF